MHDAVISLVLLAGIVAALIFTRSRGLAIQIVVETVLLLTIGTFLMWEGTSPLPLGGSVPPGLGGAWSRALAVVWWLLGARLIVNITAVARGRDPKSRATRLFSDLAAAVIYIATVLIILNSVLDLNVRGLLVTSGVIAIALGLALQSTLADVFSGIAVSLDQPFHLGDRISLDEGTEGVIVQMNWRSIRIQTDADDLATIPNSIIAKARIINRSMPTRRRAASVDIVAPAEVPSEVVVELIRQAALLCPILLPVPAPSITIQRAGLRSCTYEISFFVADSPAVSAAKNMLLRQTRRLFRHAGIDRPAPMSPVELLASLVIFEALSADEVASLAKDLVVRPVEPGDTIFVQGAAAHALFVIAAGVMEASRHDAKSVLQTIGRIGAGEYVGELGLITGSPRACSLTALTAGRVLELSGDSLKRLLQSNKALNAAMERSVRKGLALLEREDATRAEHVTEQTGDLFARMKAFFHV